MPESKYSAQAKSIRKNYIRFSLDFRPEVLNEFRALCEANGTTATTVIKQAVMDYIQKYKQET